MRYLVVGANGQLGKEIIKLLEELGANFVSFSSEQLDITNREAVFSTLKFENPDVVLDAAAYTAVDAAEQEGKSRNWQVNSEGTKNLADATLEINSTLIYVSTDYVFDGLKSTPYSEIDNVNPRNEYGKAKLSGEKAVVSSGVKYYIVRTSWVFGEFGNNFVYTMRKLSQNVEEISVVNDQKGRPTWTRTLAEFMIYLIQSGAKQGVYNLSNDGETSWYGFAKEILKNENVTIRPVSSDEFPTSAYRPKNSILNLDKAKKTGFNIPTWKEALYSFEKNISLNEVAKKD